MKNRNSKKGMTLIEILIVVTLLGILAGVLVKSLGGSLETGKTAATKIFASTALKRAVESYKTFHDGNEPQTLDDLKDYFEGRQIPTDAWGGVYTIVPGEIRTPKADGNGYDITPGGIGGIRDSQGHAFSLAGVQM